MSTGSWISAPTPSARLLTSTFLVTLAAIVISVGFIIQMTSNQSNAWVSRTSGATRSRPLFADSDWIFQEQIMMGRFCSGLGVGALSANVPIYQVRYNILLALGQFCLHLNPVLHHDPV